MITDAVGEQILADVIAHPDDDGLRRVYHDWLVDSGDWVRAAILMTGDNVAPMLHGEEHATWWPPGPDIGRFRMDCPATVEWCRWRAGFVEEVGCTLEQLLDHGPALVRGHPLRKVTLTDCRQEHSGPEGGPPEGWISLVGAANPPPGANLQEIFAGPPFSHELWHGLARALRFGLHYHPTREAAVTFLSDSALRWARAEARRRDLAAALSVTGGAVV